MKRKVLAGLLASVSVLGLGLSGTTALAATQERSSDATIGFAEPEIPGTLQFRHIPVTNAFDFGANNAAPTGSNGVFNKSDSAYIVIQEGRDEVVGNQWALSANLSQITNVATSSDILSGAQLLFTGTSRDYNDLTGDGMTPPTANGAISNQSNSTAIATTPNVTLNQASGSQSFPVELLRDGTSGASSTEGYSALEMSNIRLNVIADTANAGQYKGTITWSLNDLV
ncbi:WxL domain-containing protein [Enterococcus sp. ALS3]|uniref:WxL domain-containing protein n=1 Tax=Enterococcus alishanensis TaxID=1303817 RepID=A0ABS6THC2_9ENTE|nr:WxL domain-containing protein [Enterococcus alishanensis]MBV7392278.1 WxL domain-containing protein [Enterococcus alishanensis]